MKRQQIYYAALDAHVTLAVFDAVAALLGYDVSCGIAELYKFEKSSNVDMMSESDMLLKYCSPRNYVR